MAGAYSGNLVRMQQQPDALKLPAPAVEHGQDEPDPWPDRHEVPAGYGQEFGGSAFPVDVTIGGGVLLSTPPKWGEPDTHDSPAVLYPLESDTQQVAVVGDEHAGDYDRGHLRHYYEPGIQSAYEQHTDATMDLWSSQATNTAPLTRGINSYRENNPDREGYINGFRPGRHRWLVDNLRRLIGERGRTYDVQTLIARDYYQPVNQPELADVPPYGPVFSSWVDGMLHWGTQAQVTRMPEDFDGSMIANPQLEESAVIGGGF
jgi:hypothetical protein